MIDRVDDGPLRFYFEHREQIESWAALRAQGVEFARGVLAEVGDELEARIRRGSPEIQMKRGDDRPYGAALLYRPSWAREGSDPRAGIGIGWGSNPSLVGNGLPWIGVWAGNRPKGYPVVAALRADLAPFIFSAGFTRSTQWDWWPIYRYLKPPTGPFWDDLTPWSESVIEAVILAWDRLADPVERTLASLSEA